MVKIPVGGSGGREHGGAPGEVHNKWWWLLLIGSDFNPMLHHCTWWVESSGFRLSVMSLCLQADTIISLIVTSLKQWHQEVIHQSISSDMRRKMTRGPLTYAENPLLSFPWLFLPAPGNIFYSEHLTFPISPFFYKPIDLFILTRPKQVLLLLIKLAASKNFLLKKKCKKFLCKKYINKNKTLSLSYTFSFFQCNI